MWTVKAFTGEDVETFPFEIEAHARNTYEAYATAVTSLWVPAWRAELWHGEVLVEQIENPAEAPA